MTDPNNPSVLPTVEGYKRFVGHLLDDINSAIHDLRYELQGGNIIRAVDFTEIRAYVLPDEQPLWTSQTLGADHFEQVALDLSTLDFLFFGRNEELPPPVVLLPPHRRELRNAEPFFQRSAFARFRERVKKAETELNALHADRTFKTIFDDFEKAVTEDDKKKASNKLLAYVNENASSLLLATTTEKTASPAGRLRELLDNARFIDISSKEVLGRTIEPDELDNDLIAEVRRLITERRGSRIDMQKDQKVVKRELEELELRSHRDALAVAYILRINDLVGTRDQKRQHRIVLVTRSGTLISAVKAYSALVDQPRLPNFIRRASAYSIRLLEPGADRAEKLTNLLQKRRSLELAQKGLTSDYHGFVSTIAMSDKGTSLAAQITRLQALWRGAVNLAVATTGLNRGAGARRSDRSQVLTILHDKHRFQETIARAAARLAADISISNALLGLFEPRSEGTSSGPAKIEKSRRKWAASKPAFVWSKETTSAIGLYFYHPFFREQRPFIADGVKALQMFLESKLGHNVGDNLNVGRNVGEVWAVADEQSLVESCLASSFLESIVDRWGMAETYADMAVNWPARLDSGPRHETFYMRAVCRRRAHDPTEERLRMCLEDLDLAEEDFRKHSGEAADARFMLERGVMYFSLWEHVDHGFVDQSTPHVYGNADIDTNENYQNAMRLFDGAHALFESRRAASRTLQGSVARQLVDVTNARCYAYIRSGRIDDYGFRLLIEFQEAIRACNWAEQSMPIGKLDTLCWAMFLFRDRLNDPKLLAQFVRQLHRRVALHERPTKDRMVIQRHLKYMDSVLLLGLFSQDRAAA
jgi:hypothetical protein